MTHIGEDQEKGVAVRSLFTLAVTALVSGWLTPALAQDEPVSQCLAVAQNLDMPRVWYANMTANPLAQRGDVTITFEGHSTYTIVTPGGVKVATDFSGFFGANPLPRIATMNRAHSSHYTLAPDPGIEYVLPGWNPEGPGPVDHDYVVDDVYVRNVTTDIRAGDMGMIADGNSIFIFEVAGLCIGHVGHLHHPLTEDHFAQIGRLDIVMVPVDGGLTLTHTRMGELTERLRSSIVLPMHLRGNSINSFIAMMGADFAVDFLDTDSITVSVRTLPKRPTIMIPPGLGARG